MQFDHLVNIIRQHIRNSDNLVEYLFETRPRIEFTVSLLRQYGLSRKRICEIGFGAIGLACYLELGAFVEAYDCQETYKPLCDAIGIPWKYLDLNHRKNRIPDQQYNMIILCEVLEHLNRSPIEVLGELRQWIAPGSYLLLSTPNLVRLTNRLRLLRGREIFERFIQEKLVIGHFREYSMEEIRYYLEQSGYTEIDLRFFYQLEIRYSLPLRIAYVWLCRMFPRLSNYIFALAKNPL